MNTGLLEMVTEKVIQPEHLWCSLSANVQIYLKLMEMHWIVYGIISTMPKFLTNIHPSIYFFQQVYIEKTYLIPNSLKYANIKHTPNFLSACFEAMKKSVSVKSKYIVFYKITFLNAGEIFNMLRIEVIMVCQILWVV